MVYPLLCLRCTDSALNTLNNMYGYSAMEMQEAFVKIKEQAKAYLGRTLREDHQVCVCVYGRGHALAIQLTSHAFSHQRHGFLLSLPSLTSLPSHRLGSAF